MTTKSEGNDLHSALLELQNVENLELDTDQKRTSNICLRSVVLGFRF